MDSYNKFVSLVTHRKVSALQGIDPLVQLSNMGFEDSVAVAILKETKGDLNQAIDILKRQIDAKLKIEAAIKNAQPTTMSPVRQSKAVGYPSNGIIARGPKSSSIGFVSSTTDTIIDQDQVTPNVVEERNSSSTDHRRHMPCIYFGVPGRVCHNGSKCVFLHQTPLASTANGTVIVGRDVFYKYTNSPVGYCCAFNSKKGCQNGNCKYLHDCPPLSTLPDVPPVNSRAGAASAVPTTAERDVWPELPTPQAIPPVLVAATPTNSTCMSVSSTGQKCTNKAVLNLEMCKMHHDQQQQRARRLVREAAIKERKQLKRDCMPSRAGDKSTKYVPHTDPLPVVAHRHTPSPWPLGARSVSASTRAVPVVTPDGSATPSPLSLPSIDSELDPESPISSCAFGTVGRPIPVSRPGAHVSAAATKGQMVTAVTTSDDGSQLCREHSSHDNLLVREQSEWRNFMTPMVPTSQVEFGGSDATMARWPVCAFGSLCLNDATSTAAFAAAATPTAIQLPVQTTAALSKSVKKQVLSMLMVATEPARRKELALLLKEANSGTEWVAMTIEQAADEPEVNMEQLVDALLAMASVMA